MRGLTPHNSEVSINNNNEANTTTNMKSTKPQTADEMKARLLALHKELTRLRRYGRTYTKQKKAVKEMSLLLTDWHFANGEDYLQTDAMQDFLGM